MDIARCAPIGLSLVVLFALGIDPAAAQCDDRGPCTTGVLVDGVCVYTPAPAGQPCGQNSPCFHNLCDGAGHCVASGRDCDDGNPCTDDMCRIIGGQCEHWPKPVGTPCNTSSPCPSFCTSSGSCYTPPQPSICDDNNPCTEDWCHPETGCSHVNVFHSCDADHNLCTAFWMFLGGFDNDVCQGGVCTPGPPVVCDDGNVCTDDSCDPTGSCVFASNDTCGKYPPETLGYWKRLCAGLHLSGALTSATDDASVNPSGEFIGDADVACIKQSCTFSDVASVADVCDRLQANPVEDKCEQAEAQFMALLLNVCRGRVSAETPIRSHCSGRTTVGESRAEADGLLCSPLRDHQSCVQAACLSEEINSGKAK